MEVFCFPFHVQLSLGRIIALQSLVRWGSCGPQHFPFRPGLPLGALSASGWVSFNAASGGWRASGQGPTTYPRCSGKHAGKQRAELFLDLRSGSWCMFENRGSRVFFFINATVTVHMWFLVSIETKPCKKTCILTWLHIYIHLHSFISTRVVLLEVLCSRESCRTWVLQIPSLWSDFFHHFCHLLLAMQSICSLYKNRKM